MRWIKAAGREGLIKGEMEKEDEELGKEEKGCREVDTGQLDPQGSLSIHSSAFWDLESLKDKKTKEKKETWMCGV